MRERSDKIEDLEYLIELALEAGFTYAAPFDVSMLEFRPEVRAMCAEDLCRCYGKNWSCPPAVGSLDVIKKKAGRFSRGIIVQTAGVNAEEFNIDAIHDIMKGHQRNFDTLVRQVRYFCPGCLPMGAGACTRCHRCTYPDRPCRHPDRLYPSMEAYGLLVSDVCLNAGLNYNYGEDTMTFTSCILTD